jgi:hypothetical protein
MTDVAEKKAKRGQDEIKGLTTVGVAGLLRNPRPGRHADGHGLFLEITDASICRWLVRVVQRKALADGTIAPGPGARHDIRLGRAADVSLVVAREKARQLREAAHAGLNPLAIYRADLIANTAKNAPAPVAPQKPTLRSVAKETHAKLSKSWKPGKATELWLNRLDEYLFPTMGDRPVDEIRRPELIEVLNPVWDEKRATGEKLLQALNAIFDHAAVMEYRLAPSPMTLIKEGLSGTSRVIEHRAALAYTSLTLSSPLSSRS